MKIIFTLLDEGAFSDVIDCIKLEFLSGARSLIFYCNDLGSFVEAGLLSSPQA